MSQQVNLYNPLFRRQKKYFSAVTMLEALGLILLGSLLLYGYVGYRAFALEKRAAETAESYEATRASLARITAEFAARRPSQLLTAEIARLEEQAKAQRQVVAQLERGELGNTQGFSEFLRALARQKLDGLWITGFHVSGAGSDMAINGRALQPELVPVFINQLKKETVLAGRTFSLLEMHGPETGAAADGKAPAYIEFSLRKAEAEPAK